MLNMYANKPEENQAASPSPSAPDSTSGTTRRAKRKSSTNDRIIPGKVAKTSLRSTKAWREEKKLQIKEVKEKLEAIESENFEVMENLAGLFGALALKKNKFEKLPAFKEQYIYQHFPKYFHLDKKVKDLSAKLQESEKTTEKGTGKLYTLIN